MFINNLQDLYPSAIGCKNIADEDINAPTIAISVKYIKYLYDREICGGCTL